MNEAFARWIRTGRPLVTLKAAAVGGWDAGAAAAERTERADRSGLQVRRLGPRCSGCGMRRMRC